MKAKFNVLSNIYLFTTQTRLLMTQHFLFFPQCFLSYQRQESTFELHVFCRLQNAFNLVSSKIFSFGKELFCLQWKGVNAFPNNRYYTVPNLSNNSVECWQILYTFKKIKYAFFCFVFWIMKDSM